VDNAIWGMLNDTEQDLLRQVEPTKLDKLDEDGLAELHDRIRRARNKYSKLYRRRAADEVRSAGARSKGHKRHGRTLVKAEAFEEALAEVSARLAKAAKASAAALKKERIAAARGEATAAKKAAAKKKAAGKGKAKAKRAAGGTKAAKKPAARTSPKTPQSKRATAQNRASKARKQAKRDKR
jgi:hypothetical protein